MRIHATCVVIGEAGILIRGASGAGKSSLARALLAGAALAGRFGRLVGDDRVEIAALNGRLVARPVKPIEGRLEVRGVGIVGLAHRAGRGRAARRRLCRRGAGADAGGGGRRRDRRRDRYSAAGLARR